MNIRPKSIFIIVALFAFAACNPQKEKERKIRASINTYLGEIGLKNEIPRDYLITFKEYNEAGFIAYLKSENAANCEAAIATRANTILKHRRKFQSGLPLTPQEQEYDHANPKNVFAKIDDSLSKIKPDTTKIYFNVFAFQIDGEDTTWKNKFWLDSKYKIVW